MELIINELANKDHLTNDRQYNAGLRLIRENGYASVSGEPDVRYYCIKKGTSMKEDKKQWILGYMSQHKDEPVDVVSENFVNAYVNKFNPKIVEWYPYGAPKVPKLGRLLAELYKENKVGRCRHRCENWQDGYPKWFYIYYLNGSRKRN